jgi:hypothetical protein
MFKGAVPAAASIPQGLQPRRKPERRQKRKSRHVFQHAGFLFGAQEEDSNLHAVKR